MLPFERPVPWVGMCRQTSASFPGRVFDHGCVGWQPEETKAAGCFVLCIFLLCGWRSHLLSLDRDTREKRSGSLGLGFAQGPKWSCVRGDTTFCPESRRPRGVDPPWTPTNRLGRGRLRRSAKSGVSFPPVCPCFFPHWLPALARRVRTGGVVGVFARSGEADRRASIQREGSGEAKRRSGKFRAWGGAPKSRGKFG